MNKMNYYEDEEALLETEEQASWQPLNITRGASIRQEEERYIPLSTEVGSKIHQKEAHMEDEYEEPPSYYDHDPKYEGDDDDEMLVPPAEDNTRPRWSMSTNPYQTPRFYDDPMINVAHGGTPFQPYPQSYPQSYPYPMGTESNNNNVVVIQPSSNTSTVYVNTVSDYTCLSVIVILFCCLPLGVCALIKARDAQAELLVGNRSAASKHANDSRNLNIAGIIIGPIITAVIIILRIFVFHQ